MGHIYLFQIYITTLILSRNKYLRAILRFLFHYASQHFLRSFQSKILLEDFERNSK